MAVDQNVAERKRRQRGIEGMTWGMLVRALNVYKKRVAELEAKLARAERKLAKAKAEMTAPIPRGTNMKTITIAALVLAAAVPWSPMAHAQQVQSFYDRDGRLRWGSSSMRGNATTSFTDRSSRFYGSAIRNSDGTTSFYDRSGRFTGSSSRTTQPK